MPPRKYKKKNYKKRKRTYRKKTTRKYVRRTARTSGETKLSKWLWTPDGHTDNIGNQVNTPTTPLGRIY